MLSRTLLTGLMSMGLISVVVAVALGFVPAAASATEVKPAAAKYTASLAPGTLLVFVETNAYAEEAMGCTKSKFEGETPEEGGHKLNKNKPEFGSKSVGYGSVLMEMNNITFTECNFYKWEAATKKWLLVMPETKTTDTTSLNNGFWTLSAYRDATSKPFTAIAIPKAGLIIKYPECEITVSPKEVSAVFGEWTNGNATTASKDRVDGQLYYTKAGAGCKAGEQPLQWEATYNVEDIVKEGILIEP